MTEPAYNEGYDEFVELAGRHLEPLMRAEGFSASYGFSAGFDRGDVVHLYGETESGATFCVAYDDLVERCPGYSNPQGYEAGAGACVDLVVNAKPGRGVIHADFEGEDLSGPDLQLGSGDLERDLLAIREAVEALLASWR